MNAQEFTAKAEQAAVSAKLLLDAGFNTVCRIADLNSLFL